MAWHIPPGEENNFIDGRTHEHHVRFVNQVTGGEHHLIIRLGVDACPHCSRAHSKDDLGFADPHAIVQQEMEMLEANHAALMDYSDKHGVSIRVGEHHTYAPEGRKLIQRHGERHLTPPRKVQK